MGGAVKRSYLAAPILFMPVLACIACDKLYADPVVKASATSPTSTPTYYTPKTPPVPCPRTATNAAENSPCERANATCEFGTSPDQQCNAVFVCNSDQSYGLYWTEQTAPHDCPYVCPAAEQIVDGQPCTLDDPTGGTPSEDDEVVCTTSHGTCACTTGPDAAHKHARVWVCAAPAQGCPLARPLLNQICLGEQSCDYGACSFKRGLKMTCKDDVWQIEAPTCN